MALLNVSTVTIAVLQVLQADAALRLLLPDGVFFAEARPGSTRFVIVSLVSSVEFITLPRGHVQPIQARIPRSARTAIDAANPFSATISAARPLRPIPRAPHADGHGTA